MKASIAITRRKHMSDPAGQQLTELLQLNGFPVTKVRVGVYIELTCEDTVLPQQIETMCHSLLANVVTEEFRASFGPKS